MNNDQPSPKPHNLSEQPQSYGPAGSKKSKKPLIVTAIVVAAMGVVVAIGLLAAHLIDGANSPTTEVGGKLSIGAFADGAFMDNKYIDGARPMRVEGDVRVLGLSKDGSRLAVWREDSSSASSELAVYDTASLEQVASTPVDECTSWHKEDSVLCAFAQEGSAPALTAYGISDARPIGEPFYVHPMANDRASASLLRELGFAGVVDGLTILTVNASNSYLDAGAMSEEEASRAENLMGLYAVDNHMVLAIGEDGSEAWRYEMDSASSCGVVMNGGVVACLNSDAADDYGQSAIVTLGSSNGSLMAEHATSRKVTMATDGWIESDSVTAAGAEGISLGDPTKGKPVTTYDFDGRKKDDVTLPAGAAIGHMIPAPEWSAESRVTYPIEQLLRANEAEVAIDAEGTVIASHQPGSDGVVRVIRSGSDGVIVQGLARCVSRDGRSLFAVSQDYSDLSAQPRGLLVDVERGEEVSALTQGNPSLARCVNGLVVATDLGDRDDYTTLKTASIIYVPGM